MNIKEKLTKILKNDFKLSDDLILEILDPGTSDELQNILEFIKSERREDYPTVFRTQYAALGNKSVLDSLRKNKDKDKIAQINDILHRIL